MPEAISPTAALASSEGRAPKLRNPVVDLDVHARQVHGARVLPDAGPYPLLDLFLLLGDSFDVAPVLLSDERT